MKITDLENQYPKFDFKKYPSGMAFVYFICNEKLEVIYIGLTSMIYQRIATHYTRPEFFNMPIFYIETTPEDGQKLEWELIKTLKPAYNLATPPKKSKKRRERKYKVNSYKIKAMMKENKVTQVKIAEACNTTRQNISGLINSGYISERIFLKIAETLALEPKKLLIR